MSFLALAVPCPVSRPAMSSFGFDGDLRLGFAPLRGLCGAVPAAPACIFCFSSSSRTRRRTFPTMVSGFNVYPTDVEQVLYRYPKIAQVCVVGIPDDKTGEAVKAFVVLKEGQKATEKEILEWTRDPKTGLTGYRAPKHLEFRDELPTTLVGKVLRRVLLEEEKQKA